MAHLPGSALRHCLTTDCASIAMADDKNVERFDLHESMKLSRHHFSVLHQCITDLITTRWQSRAAHAEASLLAHASHDVEMCGLMPGSVDKKYV